MSDQPVEGAEPRSPELEDKLDEIMTSGVDGPTTDQKEEGVSLTPDNAREAEPTDMDNPNQGNDPGETMGGGH